jgi:hypothetical protein
MTAISWLAISTPSISSGRLATAASAPLRAAYASLLRCRRNEAGERLSRPLRNAFSPSLRLGPRELFDARHHTSQGSQAP